MSEIRILAIESSCDETAAAVISEENDIPVVLSNVISSQVDLHAKTGGVVPEVASRAHMEAIAPVVVLALTQQLKISNSKFLISKQIPNLNSEITKIRAEDYQKAIFELRNNITHIAVTAGPGLIGSLLVGFNAAKSMSYSLDLPIVPVNHIEGHIYSALNGVNSKFETLNPKQSQNPNIENSKPVSSLEFRASDFPLISLTVSGGHTSLTLMKDHGVYEAIGATIDDAVGEAYDKVAKLLGLGYPGGPAISKMAEHFRNRISNSKFLISKQIPNSKFQDSNIVFPRPILNDGTFNFSLSGLKTAVLIKTKKIMAEQGLDEPTDIDNKTKEEIAAAFEEAVADVLVTKTLRAVEKYQPKSVVFAGGVSANSYLRDSLKFKVESLKQDIDFLMPMPGMYGDNAAMIGLAAYYHIKRGDTKSWNEIHVDSNLKLV